MAETLMEKTAQNLQQRIGQLVAQYEGDMAVLRAQAQEEIEKRDLEIAGLKESIDELEKSESGSTSPVKSD